MFKNIMITAFLTLTIFSFSASAAETMLVNQVLKGDAVISTNYKGTAMILHIAGVDCPELNQAGGTAAKDFLSSMILNKKVYVTTTLVDGKHALASLSMGAGGSGNDVGAQLLQNGLCWYRNMETDNLRSTQKASYQLLSNRAKFKKIGMWKNGDMFYSNSNPESWRSLNVDQYSQQYVNGTTGNPAVNSFGRPVVPSKTPDDWRTIGKHN